MSLPVPEVSNAAIMVAKVMVGNGFKPGQGLGKEGQGIHAPIETNGQSHTAGLGYHGPKGHGRG